MKSMKWLRERRVVELSPELATHYLGYNNYPAQRPVKKSHVGDLVRKMEKGIFRFGEVALSAIRNESEVMLNGQHVCHAVLKFGMPVEAVFERFRVEDETEQSELFRQFEIKARSLKDMVKAESMALSLSWPTAITSLVVSAASLDARKELSKASLGPGGAITKEQRVELLRRYLKEGRFIYNILTSNGKMAGLKYGYHLNRAPVALVMMWTWRKSSEGAYVFWGRVRDGENLTQQMPEMKLREFLMLTKSKNSRIVDSHRRVENKEYIARSIHAWNAFRTNASTKLTYKPKNPIPKVI